MYKAIRETNGIHEETDKGILIYPNSGTGILYITNIAEAVQLNIYNGTGELVASHQLDKENMYLDFRELISGTYTLLFNGQNTTYTPVTWLK